MLELNAVMQAAAMTEGPAALADRPQPVPAPRGEPAPCGDSDDEMRDPAWDTYRRNQKIIKHWVAVNDTVSEVGYDDMEIESQHPAAAKAM